MEKQIDTENSRGRARPSVVALGCFDGVHRGHQALLSAAGEAAKKEGLPLIIWSMTGKPGDGAGLLCTEEERRRRLLAGGERVILAPFSKVRGLSCEEFVRETLFHELGAVRVFCGENFRFGAGGAGDADRLTALVAACGGETEVLPLLRHPSLPGEIVSGEEASLPPPVSATRIRALLAGGNPEGAALLLGRRFSLSEKVLHGRALGRTLGFPTANLPYPRELVPPRRGVYFGEAILPGGERFPAVCNLGVRPTVEEKGAFLLECCLLGFSGDLYGRTLRVALAEFLRPERPFPSKEALRDQVLSDLREGWKRAEARDRGGVSLPF